VTVEVTQDDIDAGRKGYGRKCPVALAIARQAGWEYVYVSPLNLWDGVNKTRPIPQAVRAFVLAYDAGQPVAPFSFTL